MSATLLFGTDLAQVVSLTATADNTTPLTLNKFSGSQTADLLQIVGTTSNQTLRVDATGTIIGAVDRTGSNLAGNSVILRAGFGTGTGGGGNVILRTNNIGASGSSAGTTLELSLRPIDSTGSYGFYDTGGALIIGLNDSTNTHVFCASSTSTSLGGFSNVLIGISGGTVLCTPTLTFGANTSSNNNLLAETLSSTNGATSTFTWSTSRVADASNRPTWSIGGLTQTFNTGLTDTLALYLDSSQNSGFGTSSPADRCDIFGTSAGLVFSANSSTATKRSRAQITPNWIDSTDATRTSNAIFYVYDTAQREAFRISTLNSDSVTTICGSAIANVQGCEIGKAISFSNSISPVSISTSQNNYNPTSLSTCSCIRQDCSANVNITGLVSSGAGRIICFQNISTTNTITLKYDSASSTAANRFYSNNSADVVLAVNSAVWLQYDGTSSRWRIISN